MILTDKLSDLEIIPPYIVAQVHSASGRLMMRALA